MLLSNLSAELARTFITQHFDPLSIGSRWKTFRELLHLKSRLCLFHHDVNSII